MGVLQLVQVRTIRNFRGLRHLVQLRENTGALVAIGRSGCLE